MSLEQVLVYKELILAGCFAVFAFYKVMAWVAMVSHTPRLSGPSPSQQATPGQVFHITQGTPNIGVGEPLRDDLECLLDRVEELESFQEELKQPPPSVSIEELDFHVMNGSTLHLDDCLEELQERGVAHVGKMKVGAMNDSKIVGKHTS